MILLFSLDLSVPLKPSSGMRVKGVASICKNGHDEDETLVALAIATDRS